MVIRQWRKSDRGSLTELAKYATDSDSGNAILAAIHVPARPLAFDVHPTLVAVDGDDLIGIGTLWENDIHPARWRVAMFGRLAFWSQDAATSLLAGLKNLRPDQRPLQTATSSRNESLSSFFQEHGFSLLMRTRCGVLPPGNIPESVATDFDNASKWITGEGIQVVPLAAFRNKPFSHSQLARLHAQIYEQGHTWDPVRDLTGGEAVELFMDSDEFLLEATYVALHRKRLIGVSSLRRTDRTGQVELGWTGAVLEDQQQRKSLVHALLGTSLCHAASENWQVSFEVDEADTILWDVITRLPLALGPDWLTFAEAGSDLRAL